jgi:predicted RNA-binding protein with PIN domain
MTVEKQLALALASAKGLEAQMMTFSQGTDNKQAKAMYEACSQIMCDVCKSLENRHMEIMSEEPQYNNQMSEQQVMAELQKASALGDLNAVVDAQNLANAKDTLKNNENSK